MSSWPFEIAMEQMETSSEPPRKRALENFDSHDMNTARDGGQASSADVKDAEVMDAEVQIFNDPIHGFIKVHPLLVKIIHTPQFQRLKDVKQLGVCYWVFPGACHNRFEHCLGTAHLCGKLIDTLRDLHRDQIEITEIESLCVRIAGLCHDLGHGPFSHFFDEVYIPRAIPDCPWKHEQGSCDLLQFMLTSNPGLQQAFRRFGLGDEEVEFIQELIQGKDPLKDTVTRICSLTHQPKWFLYEIVSNKRTGIDCDKFDYFARDCANVGVTSNFDYRRYFQNVRVLPIDDQLQICVREKEVFNLYELFHTRWSLHHRVYKHKTQAAIQDLLVEAFLKVDKMLRISESITNMKRFTVLTDSIMYDILRNESDDTNIKEAQELLKRIQRRDLYKFCGQTQPRPDSECCPDENKVATDLAELSKGDLTADRVFVSIVKIDFGMQQKDPVNEVMFYNKSHQALRVRKEQVSQILPQKFHERYVRVYAKSREDSELVQNYFEAWCRNNRCPVPHMLQGDRSGYFSPAFKPNQASQKDARGSGSSQRSLEQEFNKC